MGIYILFARKICFSPGSLFYYSLYLVLILTGKMGPLVPESAHVTMIFEISTLGIYKKDVLYEFSQKVMIPLIHRPVYYRAKSYRIYVIDMHVVDVIFSN